MRTQVDDSKQVRIRSAARNKDITEILSAVEHRRYVIGLETRYEFATSIIPQLNGIFFLPSACQDLYVVNVLK